MAGTITKQLRREHRALADILRELREGAGLTQRALAERLGWPLVTVQRNETGQRRVAAEELFPLANVFNTTPERIFRAVRRRL